MLNMTKIEKILGAKYTDFNVIIFSIKNSTTTKGYPFGYFNAYTFVKRGDHYFQLPSTLTSADGREVEKKTQFSRRLKYLVENNCVFEDVLVKDKELVVKFVNLKALDKRLLCLKI